MAISVAKWMVMISIFVVSFGLGLIPQFLLTKVKSWTTIMTNTGYHVMLSVLSCIGAGVLLSTAALHMLPENRESLAAIPRIWETLDEHFPLAELLMLAGLALIYMVEEFAHFILAENPSDPSTHGDHHQHHHHHILARHSSIAHGLPVAIPGGPRPSLLSTTGSIGGMTSHAIDESGPISIKVSSPSSASTSNNLHVNCGHGHGHGKVEHYNKDELIVYDEEPEGDTTLGSKLRSLLAVLALSFHAIMEGIAIGVENSSDLWFMFGAIASHKFVIAFCMGMELCASKAKLSTILSSVFIFAILSPIGIFIGSYLTDDGSQNGLAVSIIQGIATGTILYVIFFEILNRERERKSGTLKKFRLAGFVQFLSLAIGLGIMACLILLTSRHSHGAEPHDHDHGPIATTTEHDHDHDHGWSYA